MNSPLLSTYLVQGTVPSTGTERQTWHGVILEILYNFLAGQAVEKSENFAMSILFLILYKYKYALFFVRAQSKEIICVPFTMLTHFVSL